MTIYIKLEKYGSPSYRMYTNTTSADVERALIDEGMRNWEHITAEEFEAAQRI